MPTTNRSWYKAIGANAPITQGDLIFSFPVLTWSADADLSLKRKKEEQIIQTAHKIVRADLIVMTQACDLAQNKVRDVILCPHVSLQTERDVWNKSRVAIGKKADDNSWSNFLREVGNGTVWSLTLLNPGSAGGLTVEHRVIHFNEVYSIPRVFIENLLKKKKGKRLSLVPPYREHVSQAFARYFMRVGLPIDLEKPKV